MSSTSAVADLNCVRKCASKGSPSNICLLQRWWPRKWRARSAQHMRLEFHHETKILERVKKNSGIPINLLASWFGGRSKINLSYNEPPSFKWKFGKWLVLFKDISFQVSSVKVSNEKKTSSLSKTLNLRKLSLHFVNVHRKCRSIYRRLSVWVLFTHKLTSNWHFPTNCGKSSKLLLKKIPNWHRLSGRSGVPCRFSLLKSKVQLLKVQ